MSSPGKTHSKTSKSNDLEKQLFSAVEKEDLTKVKEIISQKPNVNWANPDMARFTSLIKASYNGNVEIAQILLENGADPNKTTIRNETALYWATLKRKPHIADLLVKHRADVNIADEHGETPLHLACLYGMKETAQIFIKNGADINKENNLRRTALHQAVNGQYPEIVKILLAEGATINKMTGERLTSPEIDKILHRWPTSQWVIMLYNLIVWHHLDTDSTVAFFEFYGPHKGSHIGGKTRKQRRAQKKK